jgi:hypothetical protein
VEGGVVAPSLLAFAVDLSKTRRRGSLPASKGLAFLHLLVLIGIQLLRQVAQGQQPHHAFVRGYLSTESEVYWMMKTTPFDILVKVGMLVNAIVIAILLAYYFSY